MNAYIRVAFFILVSLLFSSGAFSSDPARQHDDAQALLRDSVQTPFGVIMVQKDDPYIALASEIAEREHYSVCNTLADALNKKPEFLIWVASPRQLDETTLMQFGQELGEYGKIVAVGIISGSTIEHARALWQRSTDLNADTFAFLSPDEVIITDNLETIQKDFDTDSVRYALLHADYVHYSGHGTSRSWFSFHRDGIPKLPPVIVSAASCETFRPSFDDNIARTFVDSGAAAYIGFTWSPAGDYFMGDNAEGFPFRYSWPGCSIGHILQVINRGTQKVFARFPQCFLLGDPRICLCASNPARMVKDKTAGDTRTIEYADCPSGIVPLRIPDGGKYRYVEASGIASVAIDDVFYNGRLQCADVGDDKIILVEAAGDKILLKLRGKPPILWYVFDTVVDFFDLVVPVRDDQSMLKLIALIPILPLVFINAWKRKIRTADLLRVMTIGFVMGFGAWLYATTRFDSATVTAVAIDCRWIPYCVDVVLIVGAGLWFVSVNSILGKGFALIWSTFPVFVMPLLLPIHMVLKQFQTLPDFAHYHFIFTLLVGVLVKAAVLLVLLMAADGSVIARYRIRSKSVAT